jgi:hypothetical protein
MSVKADIDEAIHSHSVWKIYFYNFLHGKLALDAAHIGEDNHCRFGCWLESAGRHFLNEQDYEEIRVLHANFHYAVATIIRKIKEKDFAGAHADTASGGAFHQASETLIQRMLIASLHFGPNAQLAANARDSGAEMAKDVGGSDAQH